MTPNDSLLALIADLYGQVAALSARNDELESRVQELSSSQNGDLTDAERLEQVPGP